MRKYERGIVMEKKDFFLWGVAGAWGAGGGGGGDGASLERNVFSFSSSCVSQLLLNGM